MTLIAAFRCYEGVVLCADSQETIDIPDRGQYRVNVTKIEPRHAGEFDVVIGGGGDGDLVDDFVDQLTDRISGWAGPQSEIQMRAEIRAFVHHYYEVDVALSPAHPDDKNLGFVVCIKHNSHPDVFLWRISGVRVRPVSDKTMLGWEEAIYWHEINRLYQSNWISNHAMLLGLHLFLIAKQTSNVISGDTKVILARDNGIHAIDDADVKELEAMLGAFNKKVDDLRLVLPNMSIPFDEFKGYVRNFADEVIQMHGELLGRTAMQSLSRTTGDAFPRIPLGMQVRVGGIGRPTERFEYGYLEPETEESNSSDSQEPEEGKIE